MSIEKVTIGTAELYRGDCLEILASLSGVDAIQMGRKFIGIELQGDHFDTACRRIEEATLQPKLFDEERVPTHGTLFAEGGA